MKDMNKTNEDTGKLSGCELIAQERERQITQEGWTPEHDDKHTQFQMTMANTQSSKIWITRCR